MVTAASIRRSAWLALFALALQTVVSVAHFAAHLDHFPVGFGRAGQPLASAEPSGDPAAPSPGGPETPPQHQCPIQLGLLLSGYFVVADTTPVSIPLATDIARLDSATPVVGLPVRRHLLPLARAPPVFEIVT